MAQIGVSKVSAKNVILIDEGKYNVTLQLKCWPQGADTAADTPVIDEEVTKTAKAQVEGKTAQELVDELKGRFEDEIQARIVKYNDEDVKLNNNKMYNMVAALNITFSSSSSSSSSSGV